MKFNILSNFSASSPVASLCSVFVCVCVCVFVSVWRYTLATRRRGTTALWRINTKKAVSLALTRKLHMAFLVSLLVGYTMRDIRYKWNEGPNSVGVSNEVSLPQFKVLGHRQRAMEISLTTGISCKCHSHTLTTDISYKCHSNTLTTYISYECHCHTLTTDISYEWLS